MKNLYSILFWGFAALLSACSEDLGNYDYTAPEIPAFLLSAIRIPLS